MQFSTLIRVAVFAVLAIATLADYDDNSVGTIPVAVDLDYFSNYVKKGGPQGPLRFGKRRGPSGPLRFGKRSSFHVAPAAEDVASWYQ
ncbi:FMRF-Like Peptide [Caenorhabditis elegans]|uniref:FMRF-Like Peptide n=1 Tax=Caenorhabditis elegans TaxID=6239 RepID=O46023_CAEEL|nr:FMRF-Like Peptide [Caenorhabditis elegans]CAB05022.1 FMRF-Like Peptide [Caenorhabditis elegans]|eukprot:NP_499820.1 FMRF-Like Peptide [Caenorhabditis elegans]